MEKAIPDDGKSVTQWEDGKLVRSFWVTLQNGNKILVKKTLRDEGGPANDIELAGSLRPTSKAWHPR